MTRSRSSVSLLTITMVSLLQISCSSRPGATQTYIEATGVGAAIGGVVAAVSSGKALEGVAIGTLLGVLAGYVVDHELAEYSITKTNLISLIEKAKTNNYMLEKQIAALRETNRNLQASINKIQTSNELYGSKRENLLNDLGSLEKEVVSVKEGDERLLRNIRNSFLEDSNVDSELMSELRTMEQKIEIAILDSSSLIERINYAKQII